MANICIVDSDQDNIDSLTEMLQPEAHKLSFFNTSESLLNSLKKKEADMIIIGVQLQDEDGRALSKMLQTESVYKDIPVILTSPFYHTEGEIRSFYCDDLISAPFDHQQVNTSVNELLAKGKVKALRAEKMVS